MSWTTRPGRRNPPSDYAGSPVLLYHKWHAYDGNNNDYRLDTKESGIQFLERVAELVDKASKDDRYRGWHKQYCKAIVALGADVSFQATTVWRLIVGFATNPALETGITLHPLHGFPYIPGSAVRGLVRRVAECELVERHAPWVDSPSEGQLPGDDELSKFLDEAEKLQVFLGSLAVAPAAKGNDPGWKTPLEVLERLRTLLEQQPEKAQLLRKVKALVEGQTGGQVVFYDAVPLPGQTGLLQTDILNPHYPKYYKDGSHPPSDDQDPNPVYFLAVKPGASFLFPFRVASDAEGWKEKVCTWLRQGLDLWGAGGKTAAGYGYFHFSDPEKPDTKPVTNPDGRQPDPSRPEPQPEWLNQVRNLNAGNANQIVPLLLKKLSGTELRRAAEEIQKTLGQLLKEKRWKEKDWVLEIKRILAQEAGA